MDLGVPVAVDGGNLSRSDAHDRRCVWFRSQSLVKEFDEHPLQVIMGLAHHPFFVITSTFNITTPRIVSGQVDSFRSVSPILHTKIKRLALLVNRLCT